MKIIKVYVFALIAGSLAIADESNRENEQAVSSISAADYSIFDNFISNIKSSPVIGAVLAFSMHGLVRHRHFAVGGNIVNSVIWYLGLSNALGLLRTYFRRPVSDYPEEFITACSNELKGSIMVIQSWSDWNGALVHTIDKLIGEIGPQYAVYFIRAKSLQDIERSMVKLKNVCKLPIKGLIVISHGNENIMEINSQDLTPEYVSTLPVLNTHLDSDASIVLYTCSIGSQPDKRDGLIMSFALAAPGRKVYAPDSVSSAETTVIETKEAGLKATFFPWYEKFLPLRNLLPSRTVCCTSLGTGDLSRC